MAFLTLDKHIFHKLDYPWLGEDDFPELLDIIIRSLFFKNA